MKLRYKIFNGVLIVLLLGVASLALVLSHTDDCPPAPAVSPDAETMHAIVYRCYGSPDVVRYEKIEKPQPAANEVLVRIVTASVNPLDWHFVRGEPYFMRLMSGLGSPAVTRLGVDFAGTVEAVGNNVTRFKPGDNVFGGKAGAFAEYVVIPEDGPIVKKPDGVTFEQAASTPIAAVTALQALRDKGQLEWGDKVLINGSSGGVGTFAVQIAKSMGADVTGVNSTRNVEMVLSLGADRVFDYTKEDYTESGQTFDVIVDMVSNHSLQKNRKVLAPDGRYVMVGGAKGKWLAPMMGPLKALLLSPFVDEELAVLLAEITADDLEVIGELLEDGRVKAAIDSRYALKDVKAALEHSEKGRARGKIIIEVSE